MAAVTQILAPQRSAGLAVAGLLLAALAGSCATLDPDDPDARGISDPSEALVLPCDGAAIRSAALRTDQRQSAEEILVSAPYLGLNEVHDCQRLLIDGAGGLSFGPLTALAVDTAALVALDPGSPAAVVADVVNLDTALSYGPLNIRPGVNCLVVEPGSDPDGTDWRAAIVQTASQDCTEATVPAIDRGVSLQVRRTEVSAGSAGYPSTGRWLWDDEARRQFVGLRCGNAWCEMGLAGFAPTAGVTTYEGIPGWSDRQYLGWINGGTLEVSGIWGHIEPEPVLRTIQTPGDVGWGHGLHVATIHLQGGSTAERRFYHDKLQLPPGMASYEVFLRARVSGSDSEWQVRTDGSKWKPIRRNSNRHGVIGSVRWLWLETDEGGWLPCDQGCCPVDQLERKAR